ncbi:IS5 family transposase [Streptomyces sp. NPDC002206]
MTGECCAGSCSCLYTGIPWRHLPPEFGFGSGFTCRRRLRDWHETGVWQRLSRTAAVRVARSRDARLLPRCRRLLACARDERRAGHRSVPADRGMTGSKHLLIVEAHGIPLAVTLTGGNRNDVTELIPLIQAVPPIRGKRGQPLRRPRRIYADRGYDHDVYRDRVRRLKINPVIARRGTEHVSGLGVHHWVVEGAIALVH